MKIENSLFRESTQTEHIIWRPSGFDLDDNPAKAEEDTNPDRSRY